MEFKDFKNFERRVCAILGWETEEDKREKEKSSKEAEKKGIRGFCVVCEMEGPMEQHLLNHHLNMFDMRNVLCYQIFDFEGTQILAPRKTDLRGELARCGTCFGVFYQHRYRNHPCRLAAGQGIDEGRGPDYCPMCQMRCPDLEVHIREAHRDNQIYDRTIMPTADGRIRTIVPNHAFIPNEFVHRSSADCACGHCVPFTFKNRFRPRCPNMPTAGPEDEPARDF